MSKVVIVFLPSTGHVFVSGQVMKSIPHQKRTKNSKEKVAEKKQNNCFSTMIAQLAKDGLYISKVYRNTGPEIVVFETGTVVDVYAENLFRDFTEVVGWKVMRYDNSDGSIAFAARSPFWADGHNQFERLESIFYGDDFCQESTLIQL